MIFRGLAGIPFPKSNAKIALTLYFSLSCGRNEGRGQLFIAVCEVRPDLPPKYQMQSC